MQLYNVKCCIGLTKTIRKYLDEWKFDCGIFVEIQKAFDMAEHDILLTKLEHYGDRDPEWCRALKVAKGP